MRTFHNMNIILQNIGRDVYLLNGNIKIPNKTLSYIIKPPLLKSSKKKYFWWFPYQYSIWISCRTENRYACMFLSTSHYTLPKLWSGGVPTSVSGYSWPRLYESAHKNNEGQKIIIVCMVILLNYFGMDKYHHTNT